jgi:hypothetical protein
MFRFSFNSLDASSILFLVIFLSSALVVAQVETATVSGQVVDSSGLRVVGAQVDLIDVDRATDTNGVTDNSGLYRFASVHPGRYRVHVRAPGFRAIDVTGLTVNVQDHLEQNFKLTVGSVSESVTVNSGASLVDTETASVSTVVDHQFAENLPMNGRSFQTLIELTPGVVLTSGNAADAGQFAVNGQRASANYWTVDGVSANIGTGSQASFGSSLGGNVGAFSTSGGTNSLVSIDALQEFRIQTSSYAPEFGRTPGAQISIMTRSGTNRFHGTAFDYFRNDVFDASNWFNGYTNNAPLPKAEERQNDFGGTLSGPVLRNRAFFFFSYEGLRLRLPQTERTTVPDLVARRSAIPAMRPYLDVFPVPNATDDSSTNVANFSATYSNPSTLDAYSVRIDHNWNNRLSIFGRYNYSPSEISQRGGNGVDPLSEVNRQRITIQTGTLGATWSVSHRILDDLRVNYSRVTASNTFILDDFGGGVPLVSVPFPSQFTTHDGFFSESIGSLGAGSLNVGLAQQNRQSQINLVDNLSSQAAQHSLKFGMDFRRLAPQSSAVFSLRQIQDEHPFISNIKRRGANA